VSNIVNKISNFFEYLDVTVQNEIYLRNRYLGQQDK